MGQEREERVRNSETREGIGMGKGGRGKGAMGERRGDWGMGWGRGWMKEGEEKSRTGPSTRLEGHKD